MPSAVVDLLSRDGDMAWVDGAFLSSSPIVLSSAGGSSVVNVDAEAEADVVVVVVVVVLVVVAVV